MKAFFSGLLAMFQGHDVFDIVNFISGIIISIAGLVITIAQFRQDQKEADAARKEEETKQEIVKYINQQADLNSWTNACNAHIDQVNTGAELLKKEVTPNQLRTTIVQLENDIRKMEELNEHIEALIVDVLAKYHAHLSPFQCELMMGMIHSVKQVRRLMRKAEEMRIDAAKKFDDNLKIFQGDGAFELKKALLLKNIDECMQVHKQLAELIDEDKEIVEKVYLFRKTLGVSTNDAPDGATQPASGGEKGCSQNEERSE